MTDSIPNLRRSLFARLGGLLLGSLIVIGAGLWLGYSRTGGGPVDGFVIAGSVAALGVIGLVVWIAIQLDEGLAKPMQRLAGDLSANARTDVGGAADLINSPQLGVLADASNEIVSALRRARSESKDAIAAETAKVQRQKALLEALLQDLGEGVLVLSPDHRVMLYNKRAQSFLPGLGLDRPIKNYLRDEPLINAFKRMNAMRERGHIDTVECLVASEEGERFFLMRAAPVVFEDAPIGTVMLLRDATDDLAAHAEYDHLFNTLLEGVRRQASAIGAVVDVLKSDDDMPREVRQRFNSSMHDELEGLFARLREMGDVHDASLVSHWPTSEVASEDLFDGLNAKEITKLRMSGKSLFTSCDVFAVLELLAQLLKQLKETGARYDFMFAAEPHDDQVWLTLAWSGTEATEHDLDTWLCDPLEHGNGQYTGRDVLIGHRTDIWPEVDGLGYRIVLPLTAAHEPGKVLVEERAEFYDFDLPPASTLGNLAGLPLESLRFVVFDTETTGLEPSNGDEIIQIAGVRVVNGRVLQGEAFDTYVDPKRKIPAVSTEIHGITQDMVLGAPDIAKVGRDFHAFCEGSVLVAHNAPFDMAFLKRKQEAIGRTFDQPVLCTVLLSAALYDFAESHTLDALASRLGVEIPPNMRHTAIGDTVATAQVFLRLIDVMKGKGILTLGQALEAADRMVDYRKAQKY